MQEKMSKYHTTCPHCDKKIVIEIYGTDQFNLTRTKVKKEEISDIILVNNKKLRNDIKKVKHNAR